MAAEGLVKSGARSRSQYMRFKEAREDSLVMVTPEGEDRTVRVKFERRDRGQTKAITPKEYAEGKFSPVTRRTEVETIQEEMPFVRVIGYRDDGSAYASAKVATKYLKGTNAERTPYEDKIRMRREVQDGRKVVRGMGRTIVQEGYGSKPPNPSLYLIPEGHDPGKQDEVASADIHDHLKKEYRATYRKGTRTTFTFSSLQGENTYSEEHLLTPTKPNEYQPQKDAKYPFQRPYTPDEFDEYIEQAKAGNLNAQEDKLVEALENIALVGGKWKAVPVYRMLYGTKIRSYYEPSGKIANNLQEDIEMARTLKATGTADPGWQSGDQITDLETLAGYSILGRAGALHDCYAPMEVLEAEDAYMRLPRLDDALIETSPRSNVMGLVFDKKEVANWHNGVAQSKELTLDVVAGDVAGPGPQNTAQGAPAGNGNATPPPEPNAPESPGAAAPAGGSETTGEYDDMSIPEIGEEQNPF